MFGFSLKRATRKNNAHKIYAATVAQARFSKLYQDFGIDDTVDGRFDSLSLHAFLLFKRCGASSRPEMKQLSQDVYDLMFADMDGSLREMGVSDMRIGKKVKQMAVAFNGRTHAYDLGFKQGRESLAAGLMRNVYRLNIQSEERVTALVDYVLGLDRYLTSLDDLSFLTGTFQWSQT